MHLRDNWGVIGISGRLPHIFFQPDNRPAAMRSSRLEGQIPCHTLFVKNTVPHGHLFCHIFKLSKISVFYLLGNFVPIDQPWMDLL